MSWWFIYLLIGLGLVYLGTNNMAIKSRDGMFTKTEIIEGAILFAFLWGIVIPFILLKGDK